MTREFAGGFNPVRLDADGLMMPLSSLAANMEKLFGISCTFSYADPILISDQAVATHIYRIVQEALNNAIKHGKADSVAIALRQREDAVILYSSGQRLRYQQRRHTWARHGVCISCSTAPSDRTVPVLNTEDLKGKKL